MAFPSRQDGEVIRYSASFTKDIEELLNRTREMGLEGLLANAAARDMSLENAVEHGSRLSSTRSKNSSSVDTQNRNWIKLYKLRLATQTQLDTTRPCV